jgi:hypothetical protein
MPCQVTPTSLPAETPTVLPRFGSSHKYTVAELPPFLVHGAIDPLSKSKLVISEEESVGLVGACEGFGVVMGTFVGADVGILVGAGVGKEVGILVGTAVGFEVGA